MRTPPRASWMSLPRRRSLISAPARLARFETHRFQALLEVPLEALPADVQDLAHRSYAQLKADPAHPSLHFNEDRRQRAIS